MPKARDRAVDKTRKLRVQRRVVEAVLGERSSLEILREDVGFGDHLLRDSLTFRVA